jgi:hypothetical protein
VSLTDNSRIPAGAQPDPFAAPATAVPTAGAIPAGAVPAGAVSAPPPPPPPPAPETPELSYEHKVGSLVHTAQGTAVVLDQGPVTRNIGGTDYVIPGYVLGYFSGVNDLPAPAEDLGITPST